MSHKDFLALLVYLPLICAGWVFAGTELSSQEANGLVARAANGDSEALKIIKTKAELGDMRAQNKLAYLYGNGNGVEKNDAKAFELHRLSAEKGLAEAQAALGVWYENTTPPDYRQAIKWFLKAAGQGDTRSQAELCHQYYSGGNIPKDYSKAFLWCSKAAQQNDSNAQLTLGLMLAAGQGVQRDLLQALKWGLISKANEGGSVADSFVTLVESNLSRQQIASAQALAQSWWSKRIAPNNSASGGLPRQIAPR